jgi:hypothetical protein
MTFHHCCIPIVNSYDKLSKNIFFPFKNGSKDFKKYFCAKMEIQKYSQIMCKTDINYSLKRNCRHHRYAQEGGRGYFMYPLKFCVNSFAYEIAIKILNLGTSVVLNNRFDPLSIIYKNHLMDPSLPGVSSTMHL